MFQKAVKHEAKLRLSLIGPAGSGKTYTALTLATHLGGKIAVVDTEHESSTKYADDFAFEVCPLAAPYHPDRYLEAIRFAAANGYNVVILDSLTHAWSGSGGLLELVDDYAARKTKNNSFQAWGAFGTPLQNKFIEGMLATKVHIIATMRSKTEYVVEKDERTGKSSPRKVGTAPQQRDGFEYEFDVVGYLDNDNTLTIQKTRCSALQEKLIKKPGADLANTLKSWLKGAPVPVKRPEPVQQPQPGQPEKSEEQKVADGLKAVWAKAHDVFGKGSESERRLYAFLQEKNLAPWDEKKQRPSISACDYKQLRAIWNALDKLGLQSFPDEEPAGFTAAELAQIDAEDAAQAGAA